MFKIVMGLPEMKEVWDELKSKVRSGKASKDENKLFSKMGKTMAHLANNPRHPGLESHEIEELSKIVGFKVWQSYLENKTPAAGRMFWAYGPSKDEITILGVEPHPNSKSHSYKRINLSEMPVSDAAEKSEDD